MSPAMDLSQLLTAYTEWGPWENGLSHQQALREGNVSEGDREGLQCHSGICSGVLVRKSHCSAGSEPGGELALFIVMSREALLPAHPVGSGL